MTHHYGQPIIEAGRIAKMAEHMTVAQIAKRLNISETDVEDYLDQAGRKGQGKWLLECTKTGRHWRCHSERGCYLKAQMLGLTDYTFGVPAVEALPKPVILPGDINARIAELVGRGWSMARIGVEVNLSAPAVHKRLKKMRGH